MKLRRRLLLASSEPEARSKKLTYKLSLFASASFYLIVCHLESSVKEEREKPSYPLSIRAIESGGCILFIIICVVFESIKCQMKLPLVTMQIDVADSCFRVLFHRKLLLTLS